MGPLCHISKTADPFQTISSPKKSCTRQNHFLPGDIFLAFLHNFRSLKNWKSHAGLAGQQPQPHPPPGTPEAAGDQAAHSASGTRRLTPCLSGPPPPKVSPRYHYGKEHGAEGGKFAPFGRPTTWDTTAGQKRKSQWSSGCLNPNNRSCGDPGLHPHIVEPRFPAVSGDIAHRVRQLHFYFGTPEIRIVLPVRDFNFPERFS